MLPHLSRASIPLGTYGPPFLRRTLALPIEQIRTHTHIAGVSGSGKSRYMASLFLMLLRAGFSATLVDPHGDLSRLLIGHLLQSGYFDQPAGFQKLLYLDLPAAERRGRFLPMDVLHQGFDSHTTSRLVLESLKRAWSSLDSGIAVNFENIVLAGTYVLSFHHLPITLLHDLLIKKAWRDQLLDRIDDPQVVSFFHERFDKWGKEQPMLIESSLRRIFLLSFSPVLRYSLAQHSVPNVLTFRRIMDSNQSVIVNLALSDADSRRLLGCLLTVSAEQAALSRADLPPEQRPNAHFLMLDEFAEFSSQSEESLARILSLCRKFGLLLVLSNQTWTQASERLKGALGNVGIEVAFRLSRADAEYSATIFGRVNPHLVKHMVADDAAVERTHPVFYNLQEQWNAWAEAIADLKPRQAFVRLPNGKVAQIQSLAVPDPTVSEQRLAEVEEHYLQTYFTPRAQVEAALGQIQHEEPRREGMTQVDTHISMTGRANEAWQYAGNTMNGQVARSEPLPDQRD
jgi:hypothetical protein